MKRKNEKDEALSFDFDTPAERPAVRKSQEARHPAGFMSEVENAEKYSWGRKQEDSRVNVLTPEEVMRAHASQRGERVRSSEFQSAQVKAAMPGTKPGQAAEKPAEKPSDGTKKSGEMSFAARMVMQRMKELESRSAADNEPVIRKMPVLEPEKIEMSRFRTAALEDEPSAPEAPAKAPAAPAEPDANAFRAQTEQPKAEKPASDRRFGAAPAAPAARASGFAAAEAAEAPKAPVAPAKPSAPIKPAAPEAAAPAPKHAEDVSEVETARRSRIEAFVLDNDRVSEAAASDYAAPSAAAAAAAAKAAALHTNEPAAYNTAASGSDAAQPRTDRSRFARFTDSADSSARPIAPKVQPAEAAAATATAAATAAAAAANAAADAADSGATVMFTVPKAADKSVDGATKQIDFDGDFTFIDEQEKKKQIETIDDYTSVDDADAVISDFTSRRSKLAVRSIIGAVISALLLVLTLTGTVIPFDRSAFFITSAVLLGIGMISNIGVFSSVASLFRGRPDTDFAPMLAVTAAFVQNIVVWLNGADSGMHAISMMSAAAMLSLTFNCVGKWYMVRRVLANLDLVANEEYKYAAAFVEPPVSANIADPNKVGESIIVGRRKAVDLTGFIGFSLSADPYERRSFAMMIVSLVAGVLAVAFTLLTKGSAASAVTAFATVAAVSAPFSALISVGRRMFRLSRALNREGAMLSGYRAAEEVAEANVIALDSDEIFFDECVSLYNFKTFNNFPVDRAIITAAALAREGSSPLSGMFNQIVATNSGKLPDVDTVIYEEKMGLTGWINDKKVMLGNRMILEAHNIQVPPLSVDKKIVESGKFPVYLAVDDKIAAMFIVGYKAERNLVHRLRRLVNTGVTIAVDNTDPNVTSELICDCYGLPDDSVVIMKADGARIYRENVRPAVHEEARLSSATARGFIDGYVAAFNVQRSASVTAVVTTILVCISIALSVVMPLLGMGDFINSGSVIVLHLISWLLCIVVNFFNRL